MKYQDDHDWYEVPEQTKQDGSQHFIEVGQRRVQVNEVPSRSSQIRQVKDAKDEPECLDFLVEDIFVALTLGELVTLFLKSIDQINHTC